jgi:DNA-binding beta-propeller fold protein YncE
MRLQHVRTHLIVLAGAFIAGPAPAAEPASSLELVQTIALKGKAGKLDHLALDAKRERLFLANSINGTLDVVDLKAGKLLKQVPGQTNIQGIAYAADLDRVFVGLGAGGLCNVFDGADYKLLKTIKFADDADNVRYDPARHLAFVAHAEKALGVIDAKTFALKADIKLPGTAEGFQIESARPRLFLVMPSPSSVAVIDPDKKEIVSTYPVKMAGIGHPLALDEANKRMFVGCRKAPMVVVMDTETGKEIAGVPVPDGIDDLFYDARRKRLYASCGDGFLAVIRQLDADHYEVAEKVATAKQAKTSLFDAETGRIYLAVPRQPGKDGPEIRVYQVRG